MKKDIYSGKYFILHEDKMSKTIYADGMTNKIPWVEAGGYYIVRHFDKDRVLVNLSKRQDYRMLTLLPIKDGEIFDV